MRIIIPEKTRTGVILSGRKGISPRYHFRFHNLVLLLITAIALQGCFSRSVHQQPGTSVDTSGGGYYGGDRPPASVPENLDDIPDAVVRAEPRSRTGNNPYEALGKKYYPMQEAAGFTQVGIASWYGKKFHGHLTSNGEIYDMYKMTAAHKTLPLGVYVRVTHLQNGRSIVVRVNDRGPFKKERLIDLSYAAAVKLDFVKQGTTRVKVEAIVPEGSHSEVQNVIYIPDNKQMFVQVGAYRDAGKARKLAAAMSPHLPWKVMILKVRVNRKLLHRVRVGPIKSTDAANRLIKALTMPELGQPKVVFE